MVVAPDLRDGRPPVEARWKNVSYCFKVVSIYNSAPPLLVACRPGGPAPLPSGYYEEVTFDNVYGVYGIGHSWGIWLGVTDW